MKNVVLILSMILLCITGCKSSDMPKVESYNKEVELGVDEYLTLDKLNIVSSDDIDFDFKKKSYEKVGTYRETISYSGGKIRVKVIVKDKNAPEIKGAKDITVLEGEKIDLFDGVSAVDDVDGDVTSRISVSKYSINLLDEKQKIVYTVKDSSGNISKKEVTLLVVGKSVESVNKVMCTTDSVNVRAGASVLSEKLGSLKVNEDVTVVGRDRETGWYQIKYKNALGYVSDYYLRDK